MNPLQSVIVESLPTPDVNADPSSVKDVNVTPSVTPPVETPTPKVEAKEPPFHEHPRWIERQRELDELRRQNQQLLELAKMHSPQPAPNQADPYAGMDQETRRFWEEADKRAKLAAQSVVGEKEKQLEATIMDIKATQMAIIYDRFREKHPDVIPNSPEENQIAQKVQMGYSLDDAYTLVMSPQKTAQEVEKAVAKYKAELESKMKIKQAANLESTQPVSGLTPQKKLSIREFLSQEIDKTKAS